MEFTDKALILKIGKFKEADLWVRFLSPGRGVFTAFAFGGSRSIKRFCGCLDFLNTVLVRVVGSRQKNYLALNEATLISGPSRLRHDLNRLGMAVNCLKFTEAFDVTPESATPTHALVTELLTLLEQDEHLPPLLPMLFRFRFASLQGFAPQINACRICKSPASDLSCLFFQTVEGGIICPACLQKNRPGPLVRLAPQSLAALNCVQHDEPKTWKYIDFNKEMREQCAHAVDDFIHYHVGLAWQGSYFRRV